MEYKIEYDAILPIVEEEIARVAARSYSSDGTSLYDGIRLSSRDSETLQRMIDDMVASIKSRFRLFVSSGQGTSLSIYLPDLPDYLEYGISLSLNRFVSYGVIARWLKDKEHNQSQLYQDRSTEAINEAELMMMKRKSITREV